MTYEERNQRDAETFLVNPDEQPKAKRSNEYDDDFTDQE